MKAMGTQWNDIAAYRPATAADPYHPRLRWEDMADYRDGELVLSRNATRQVFGAREGDVWLEMVDGDEIPVPGYSPDEWARVTPEMKLRYV